MKQFRGIEIVGVVKKAMPQNQFIKNEAVAAAELGTRRIEMRRTRVPKPVAQHNHTPQERSACEICNNNRAFELPESLFAALLAGKVVLFAGAGVSTESSTLFPSSFYETIGEELSIQSSETLAFPDLMTRFCRERDGRGDLLRLIKDRFDYVRSFPELYRRATAFHRELSTIFHLREIITTNWDEYFERECDAIPFVTAQDFAFWSLPGRKVLKIHGSISSLGSLVATRQDYDRCYARLSSGLLGSSLKLLLATKTIVFLGFSFRDDDFLRIQKLLLRETAGIQPRAYIVTLDQDSDSRFQELGVNPIYTDATFFLSTLKQRLSTEGQLVPEENFAKVYDFLDRVTEAHTKTLGIDATRHPDVIYCWAYQDGLIHALERIWALRRSGYYSHRCNSVNAARTYEFQLRKERLLKREYPEVAYIDGYVAGLLYFVGSNEIRRLTPYYYLYGSGRAFQSERAFLTALRGGVAGNKAAHKLACNILKKYGGERITLHHPPFL